MKRHWGLFNGGISDRVKKDASLSLRQGFFTQDVAGACKRKLSWTRRKPRASMESKDTAAQIPQT